MGLDKMEFDTPVHVYYFMLIEVHSCLHSFMSRASFTQLQDILGTKNIQLCLCCMDKCTHVHVVELA